MNLIGINSFSHPVERQHDGESHGRGGRGDRENKIAKICPVSGERDVDFEKAIKLILAALSINSMDIRMPIILRRTKTP